MSNSVFKHSFSALLYVKRIFLALSGKVFTIAEVENIKKEVRRQTGTEIKSLQSLVENLRERVAELSKHADLADRAMQRLSMSQSLLEKTNNSLEDLCTYMELADAEKMRAMAQELSWNDSLSRIIRLTLQLLQRKSELEKHLQVIGNSHEWNNDNLD